MKKILYLLLLFITACSCSKNLIDGGVHSPNVNKTTLEFLQSQAKFDTVMILFEKAGLLDELNNQNSTVFIPTDYTVGRYVLQIRTQLRIEQSDENLQYTFTNLLTDFGTYKDSMKMYIVNQRISREELTSKITTKSLFGNDVEIALTPTKLYTEWLPNSEPKLVHYKWVKNGLDPEDSNSVPEADKDVDNICQTSGIITTTGVIHVLEDKHNLFYNKRQL